MPNLNVAVFTHRGAVRASNQDAVFAAGTISQADMRDVITHRLAGGSHGFMVADGIGGQPHGDVASLAALRFLSSQAGLLDGASACEATLHAANAHLYEMMDDPARIGMGTTVAGIVVQDAATIAFNVGDSRAYRFGRSGLVKLSHEDVVVSAHDGRRAAGSHAITQALGGCAFPVAIAPHLSAGPPMQAGDRFLLCTDGLTDVIDDDEIEAMVGLAESCAAVVGKLVRRAINAGSRDNISVIVGACA
ncbi:MAG: protein phosphatase 2C domain-containing protein [bacterium]|nr:protein phosphatase 2C domain-containing protein [bacterium]